MRSDRLLGAAVALLVGHVVALVFGTLGMLIALPNPSLWSGSEAGREAFKFGMQHGGALHMILGAAAMFLFGVYAVGLRKTAIFFGLSCAISLSAELLGTMTGVPFGSYEYMGGLGEKVLDHVPYTIPLSWFYMGFAGYVLARGIVERFRLSPVHLFNIALGVWLLTAWDLVLDVAMAHESLRLKFWVWHETGPYFGMPLKNFAGWALTGFLFMAISRRVWGEDIPADSGPAAFPLTVYVANTLFAVAISLSIGIWEPVAAALLLGVVPACFALGRRAAGGAARVGGLRRRPTEG